MTRLQRCAIVSLSVLAACVVNSGSNQSNNPDAGKYDDYYSEKGGSSGGGTTDGGSGGGSTATPTPHAVSSTKGVKPKISKLVGKREPVPGGNKPRPTKPPAPIEGLVFDGVVPTNAGVGSVVEILGSGFGAKPGDVIVTVGGKRQKVVAVAADHLLFKVDAKADGPIAIVRGGRPVGRVKAGAAAPVRSIKSDVVFHVIASDSNFGKPRTDPTHGLVANVYNIGKEVTELPAFDSLGEPIATYAVDSLDIAAGQFSGAFKSKDAEVKEWFAIHFKGSINISEAGTYNFCLAAGDGAQLYLDENLVVDNDGVHDTTEKCENVAVEPGEYKVDVLYFQAAAGEAGLQLSWAKDGGAKAIIPKENLFPPEDVATMARK